MARAAQMRAPKGPGVWARIHARRGVGKAGLGCGSLVSALEELLFLLQGLGRRPLGSLLVGSWAVSWGLSGSLCVCVCVCVFMRQMLCDMAQVLELRLILRQPSPLWLSFTVEELQIFQQGPKVSDQLRAVGWPFLHGAPSYGWKAWGCGWQWMGKDGETHREISQVGILEAHDER